MRRSVILSESELPAAADVVVVGAGIVGVSSAFFCSHMGLKTVVVEKREAIGTLTTARSTECFRVQFQDEASIELMRGSIEIFEHFKEVVGDPDAAISFRPQGYLYATMDAEQAEEYQRMVEAQHRLGLTDVELLSGDEVRARFPYIHRDVVAARYRAGDGWLSVHELVYGLAKGSQARFLMGTAVVGITLDSRGVAGVETSRGPIATRTVVVAAGPFSGRVARMADLELPLVLLRRHRLAVIRCDLVPRWAPFTMDDDTGVYWRPEGAGALMGKACEDEPDEPMETVPVDWPFPAMVLDPSSPWSAGRLSPFWNEAKDILRRTNLDLCAGQYTYTPDHLPIIGPCPEVPGLFINTGYSGHGIMGGPAGGRRLSKLVVGEASDAENPFSLTRLEGSTGDLKPKEKIY